MVKVIDARVLDSFKYEFAEEIDPNTDPNKDTNTDPNKQDKSNPDAGEKDKMIPKSRFDEINSKYKDVQSKLDALLAEKEKADADKAKADKKAKEEQGKYEELYKNANTELEKFKGESETSKSRVQALEGVINGLLEAKLEAVPEEFHDLIPSNLTSEAKLAWLTTAEQKGLFGNAQQKKETPIGQSTNPAGKQTTDLNQLSPMELLKAGYGAK